MTQGRMLVRHVAWVLLLSVLLCTAVLAAITYWATPTVVIQNHSPDAVRVAAQWGTSRKQLPGIAPGATRTFKIAGESAVAFVVTYPDGSQITSLPMYFTTATTVTAVITDNHVNVTAKR